MSAIPLISPENQGLSWRRFMLGDMVFFILVLFLSYGVVLLWDTGNQPFVEAVAIDTSVASLPKYMALSLIRSLIALVCSYTFAILYGKIASSSYRAERFMIPILDVLQSLPVLAFLPGFVLTLITVFNSSRWGLEISCVLMIFTGQVWNLVFAYYESQRKMPRDYYELAHVENFTKIQKFLWIDLPNGARPLIYNGMMSMAGGWFFLTLCESFILKEQAYILPGLGSYLNETFQNRLYENFIYAVVALCAIILGVDFFLWRPLIAWSARFKDSVSSNDIPVPQTSSRFFSVLKHFAVFEKILKYLKRVYSFFKDFCTFIIQHSPHISFQKFDFLKHSPVLIKNVFLIIIALGLFFILPHLPHVLKLMEQVDRTTWLNTVHSLFFTLTKVLAVLVLGSLWTVPVGIFLGKRPKYSKIAQPIIQNLAAFPAPVLFPLVVMWLDDQVPFQWLIATLLMTFGNQWYILFNVISGASEIPSDIHMVGYAFEFSFYDKVTKIYLPAIFPSLLTGWITAAGGAWNSSIVAEWLKYPGGEFHATGIGAVIAEASEQGAHAHLIAAILVICVVLIVVNRAVWQPLQKYAEKIKLG